MSRFPAAFLAALTSPEVNPCLFWEGQFASGWLRLWSGLGDIVWGGNSWTGAGQLLSIGDVSESRDVVSTGTDVVLSGIPSENVAIAIDQARQGAPGRVYLGLVTLTPTGAALVTDPVILFAGLLNVPRLQGGLSRTTVNIGYVNRLADLQRPRELRYNDETQKSLYPGDRAFEYVAAIQNKAAWVK